jgi:hypothetical protein
VRLPRLQQGSSSRASSSVFRCGVSPSLHPSNPNCRPAQARTPHPPAHILAQAYTHSTSLKEHKCKHTGDFLHECPDCGKHFTVRLRARMLARTIWAWARCFLSAQTKVTQPLTHSLTHARTKARTLMHACVYTHAHTPSFFNGLGSALRTHTHAHTHRERDSRQTHIHTRTHAL